MVRTKKTMARSPPRPQRKSLSSKDKTSDHWGRINFNRKGKKLRSPPPPARRRSARLPARRHPPRSGPHQRDDPPLRRRAVVPP